MTPYELKGKVEELVDYFWPIPHAQLYRIPARLAELGLLREEAEQTGRRRRVFRLTDAGQTALREWLADRTPPSRKLVTRRSSSSSSPIWAMLATSSRLPASRQNSTAPGWKLYRSRRAELETSDEARLVSRARILRLGILHEQAYVDFWESLAAEPDRFDLD